MPELVSIIIPTYNRAHLIGETLDSVVAQTYQNWECIVVDDGSTDHTDELLKFYSEKDGRIQYHHRPSDRPKGANACRNYGFEVSAGEYIQWFDSDDLMSENKLFHQVALLKKSHAFAIAFCKWGFFNLGRDSRTKIFTDLKVYCDFESAGAFLESLAVDKGYLPFHSYLFPRKLILYSGLWLETMEINQDGEFIIRILLHSKKIVFEPNGTVLYRSHGDNRTSNLNNQRKVALVIKSWKLIESYLTLIYDNVNTSNFLIKAKDRVYINVKNNCPELIEANNFFFRAQIVADKRRKRLINRISKRVVKIFR